jgi:hypothetical protein
MKPRLKGTYVYGPFNEPINDVWYIVHYDNGIGRDDYLMNRWHATTEDAATEYAKQLATPEFPFRGTMTAGLRAKHGI